MKHTIRAVQDLGAALKQIEPHIRNPKGLRVGRDEEALGMRPREFLGNWLLCAVLCNATGQDWTFSGDPLGGDGAILSRTTRTGFQVEHVYAPAQRPDAQTDVEASLAKAVRAKAAKGPVYARGKTLVAFSEANGTWTPDRLGGELRGRHDFEALWVVALKTAVEDQYCYWVTRLDAEPAQIWSVRIDFAAADWSVICIP